jgi:DNA-binding transcriptional MerR regulator
MADAGYLTIGKVVKRLQSTYPDLSVSKVRYLEDEGLLTPSRTPGGYRLYSQADVRRLENILYMQKSRFLPLSVIREELERAQQAQEQAQQAKAAAEAAASAAANASAESGGDTSTTATAPATSAAPTVSAIPEPAPVAQDDPYIVEKLHPIESMPDLCGTSVAFVRQLAEVGIIKLERSPRGRTLVDGHDLALIRSCDRLRHFGIGPRNLRQFVQTANRESGLFEQALVPFMRRGSVDAPQGEEVRAQFNGAFNEMMILTGQLRDELIRRYFARKYPHMQQADDFGVDGDLDFA